jgi:ABC-type glutathione transport system ATPase component
MQVVFQNPHSALDPRHTIRTALAEPFQVQTKLRGIELERRIESLLDIVSLPKAFKYRYPHELSGGQKQRICIARAVALEPRLLVLDEPTSALDVSVQAQIITFLQELRQRLNLTYLFISHNLAVVRHVCDHVIVMNRGKVLENGTTEAVFAQPENEYTRQLIQSVPRLPRLAI